MIHVPFGLDDVRPVGVHHPRRTVVLREAISCLIHHTVGLCETSVVTLGSPTMQQQCRGSDPVHVDLHDLSVFCALRRLHHDVETPSPTQAPLRAQHLASNTEREAGSTLRTSQASHHLPSVGKHRGPLGDGAPGIRRYITDLVLVAASKSVTA